MTKFKVDYFGEWGWTYRIFDSILEMQKWVDSYKERNRNFIHKYSMIEVQQ